MSQEALRMLEMSYDRELKDLILHKKEFLVEKEVSSRFLVLKNLVKNNITSSLLLQNLDKDTELAINSNLELLPQEQVMS